MFAGVIFDMDGLLIDSERVVMAAWLQVAQAAGVAMSPADYLPTVGRNAADSEAILARVFGGLDAVRSGRAAVIERLRAAPAATRFPLKAGARELLEALAGRGVPIAVASSSSRDEIEERLAATGVWAHVRAAAGGDEVHAGKPDPAVYRLAAERLGLPAARCLAFEDSHNGSLAALAAGTTLVLVPDLVQPEAQVARLCHRVLASLQDALPLAAAWFPIGLQQPPAGAAAAAPVPH